jgi:hypothetical protein
MKRSLPEPEPKTTLLFKRQKPAAGSSLFPLEPVAESSLFPLEKKRIPCAKNGSASEKSEEEEEPLSFCASCEKDFLSVGLIACFLCQKRMCASCLSTLHLTSGLLEICDRCHDDNPIIGSMEGYAEKSSLPPEEGRRRDAIKKTYEDMFSRGWLPEGWVYTCEESRAKHETSSEETKPKIPVVLEEDDVPAIQFTSLDTNALSTLETLQTVYFQPKTREIHDLLIRAFVPEVTKNKTYGKVNRDLFDVFVDAGLGFDVSLNNQLRLWSGLRDASLFPRLFNPIGQQGSGRTLKRTINEHVGEMWAMDAEDTENGWDTSERIVYNVTSVFMGLTEQCK